MTKSDRDFTSTSDGRIKDYQLRLLAEELDYFHYRYLHMLKRNFLFQKSLGVLDFFGIQIAPSAPVAALRLAPDDGPGTDAGFKRHAPAEMAPISRDAPGPTVLLDITNTYRTKQRGGISRVCNELARSAAASRQAVPVIIERGRLAPCPQYSNRTALNLHEGDAYIIIDSFWDAIDDYIAVVQELRSKGVRSYVVVHDMVPLTYPGLVPKGFAEIFTRSINRLVGLVDGFLSVSRSSIETVARHFAAPGYQALRYGWFHLGSDFCSNAHNIVSDQTIEIFRKTPNFLSVGTVEPKKGFSVALDAFEILWAAGREVHYTIIGDRPGWLSKALESRLTQHPERGKRLHWLRHCSDADVSYAYQMAYCLIQPSVAEGFGLPLIEAARFGLPAIASDIDVFREIGGDDLQYFAVAQPASLADRLTGALAKRPSPIRKPFNSWAGSLDQLLGAVATMR